MESLGLHGNARVEGYRQRRHWPSSVCFDAAAVNDARAGRPPPPPLRCRRCSAVVNAAHLGHGQHQEPHVFEPRVRGARNAACHSQRACCAVALRRRRRGSPQQCLVPPPPTTTTSAAAPNTLPPPPPYSLPSLSHPQGPAAQGADPGVRGALVPGDPGGGARRRAQPDGAARPHVLCRLRLRRAPRRGGGVVRRGGEAAGVPPIRRRRAAARRQRRDDGGGGRGGAAAAARRRRERQRRGGGRS